MMPTETDAAAVVFKMKAPTTGVSVRMYNPGFGDCLLLAFAGGDGEARYVLIDCGVHHQYSGGSARMKRVADNIMAATGKHLHAVAITHDHTDHHYGFRYARKTFAEDDVIIDELWLAWIENSDDDLVKQWVKNKHLTLRALTSAINRLQQANHPLAAAMQSVLEFDVPEGFAAAGNAPPPLEFLRGKVVKKLNVPQDYKNPRDVFTIPGVPNVKVYVLGPPRNYELLNVMDDNNEVYPEMTALNERTAFAAAVLAADGEARQDEDDDLIWRSRPFDKRYEIQKIDADCKMMYEGFFHDFYGFDSDVDQSNEWRRIETDWLLSAQQLVEELDSITNNTSLVLAFELTDTTPHKVLLFVGDAQVGNWMSWQHLDDSGPGEKIDIDDLLTRTVFYKVGHHGSRNATLKEHGLERMTNSDLVAIIPVDKKWANNEKRKWEHPAEKLLAQLETSTRGRILRSDKIPQNGKKPENPGMLDQQNWKAFTDEIELENSDDPLWIQFTVK